MPADAAWCTLCYARLGARAAAPVPSVPEPAVPAPLPPAPVPSQPVPSPVLETPLTAAPTATVVAEHLDPAWPCSGCAEQVPFESMVCPRCGTAFMGGVSPNVSLKLPLVGEVVGMSAGAKFGVMAGGATVLTAAIVLILLVLGHIF